MCIVPSFPNDPLILHHRETKRMKQHELHYRELRDEPFQPRCHTNRQKAGGALNEDTAKRIVTLYTNGQSIESITKEVGRARHVVVHILQSQGVFENRPVESESQEGRDESVVVEELKEQLVGEGRKTETATVKRSESESIVEESLGKVKRIRKSKLQENSKPPTTDKSKPKPVAPEITTATGRWAPQVVDALFKVVMQSKVNTGVSLEEVKRMVSRSKR